jgi:hypothetical protein
MEGFTNHPIGKHYSHDCPELQIILSNPENPANHVKHLTGFTGFSGLTRLSNRTPKPHR